MARYKVKNKSDYPKVINGQKVPANDSKELEVLVKEAEELKGGRYLEFERVEETSSSEEDEEQNQVQTSDEEGGEN